MAAGPIKVTPEEVSSLGRKCRDEAVKVDDVRNAIRTQIGSTNWDSPAASRFKDDWNNKFEKVLTELSTSLQSLGQAAQTMATNYENTESSYGGAG